MAPRPVSTRGPGWTDRERAAPRGRRFSRAAESALLTGLLLLALNARGPAAVVRVKPDGNDAASGASWEQAKRTVAAAITAAEAGDEIWVVAGTYKERIRLKSGVALFGGFRGDEHDREHRDWGANLTILDGATNGVVVLIQDCGPDTILDGFRIQHGKGGGVRAVQTSGTLRNNVIRGNVGSETSAYGGGVLVSGSRASGSLVIDSNRIIDNVNFDGGGIACIDASPRIVRNVLLWNLASQNGGGISCWRNSSPLIANNLIVGNTASWLEAVAVPVGGGGIFATADDLDGRPHPTAVSAPVILNNVVAANGGWKGGGIALVDSNGGVPSVLNNTVVANHGAGIYWASAAQPLPALQPLLRNNLVAFNPWGIEQGEGTPPNPNIEFNCVFGNQIQGKRRDYQGLPDWTGVKGNLSVDPQLAGYQFGNLHLQPHSPCIDAGKLFDGVADWPDMDAQSRVQGRAVDIGADESDGTYWGTLPPTFHVTPRGEDDADGRTWNTAKRSVQAAIEQAKLIGAEVWVAAGTYPGRVVLPAFVHLFGGFAGHETDRAGRNPAANQTILDGGGVIKVVLCGHAGYLVSTLDGFTIRNGGKCTAGGGVSPYGPGGLGGGIYLGVASPVIANNLITRNSLAYDNSPIFPQPPSYGAGIYCDLSYAVITGNTIQENEILNTFDGSGGGIYCARSMPTISNNIIRWNRAVLGAAIYCVNSAPAIVGNLIQSNAMYNTWPLPLYQGSREGAVTIHLAPDFLIDGNTFQGNTAAVGAGLTAAVYLGGRIQNNLLVGNRAVQSTGLAGLGGGIYCMVTTSAVATVHLAHNTLVGNTASDFLGERGGALAISLVPPATNLVIANNILAANSSGIFQLLTTPMSPVTLLRNTLFNSGSNYINLAAGPTDLSQDPRFRDAANGDYRLRADSPCIDAGSAALALTADLDGLPRPLDGNQDGAATPDLGAFEFLNPEADSDGDQMPDGWEVVNGLALTSDDRAADRDRDGASNWAEFIAGTSPVDPASVLRLQIQMSSTTTHLILRWLSVTRRRYAVRFSRELPAEAGWETLLTIAGTGSVVEVETPAVAGASRFYRLEVSLE